MIRVTPSDQDHDLNLREVYRAWWPLAGSWLLMAFELPAVSAVVARLADPSIHLAAYGGVVFPLAILVEAPIIMLLAASTALSKDWDSYSRLRRFMRWSSLLLTVVHIALAATPLFDLIVGTLMQVPEPVREPARLGLIIMTPWTAAIAYRRFNQGVLIRHSQSRLVGVGTIVRLLGMVSVLAVGFVMGDWPGIVIAATAVTVGVVSEAIFVGLSVQPALRELRLTPLRTDPLTMGRLLRFYIPLALTSLLHLLALPLYTAGLSRLPNALESLATWPVINGLIFAFRSLGLAYNEVVVAHIDRPGSYASLRAFTLRLAGSTSGLLLLIALTPLGWIWFRGISGLDESLAVLGTSALWLTLVLPASGVYQSWHQGVLVSSHQTRALSEAVVVSLLAAVSVLVVGVQIGRFTGLYVGLTAHVTGSLVQVGWLWFRSRPELQRIRNRDQARSITN